MENIFVGYLVNHYQPEAQLFVPIWYINQMQNGILDQWPQEWVADSDSVGQSARGSS